MHHGEVVDVEPEGQLLLVGQETRIHGGKLVHQYSEEAKKKMILFLKFIE
jgi:hypothetical protein